MIDTIRSVIHSYEPITLEQMDKVSLLNRIDTKYLLNTTQLTQVLMKIARFYRVLDINDVRLSRYQTLYFDTSHFALYLRHHNQGLNRYKVRCRLYTDSMLEFLEVKFKTNKGRTIKNRRKLPQFQDDQLFEGFSQEDAAFLQIHYPYEINELEPKLWNRFSRITLVNKRAVERLTIDLNLQFQYERNTFALPHMAIAEVKQQKFSTHSDFMQQMKSHHLYPTGFSKYCFGAAKLYPHLKQNNLKPKCLLIEKLHREQYITNLA